MNNVLSEIGNIPVTASTLESFFPHIKGGNQKIRSLERNGEIIRVKRGLYVVNPEVTGKTLSTELIASHLLAPSYLSMSSALRYYGLIPEAVYTMQSMTVKHSKDFDTPLGRFEYTFISRASFPIGVTTIKKEGYAFLIASPEKALCDLIANSPKVNLRYMKEAEAYLEEDIRMDMENFMQMDLSVFEAYSRVGKKAESVKTLLKLLRR